METFKERLIKKQSTQYPNSIQKICTVCHKPFFTIPSYDSSDVLDVCELCCYKIEMNVIKDEDNHFLFFQYNFFIFIIEESIKWAKTVFIYMKSPPFKKIYNYFFIGI